MAVAAYCRAFFAVVLLGAAASNGPAAVVEELPAETLGFAMVRDLSAVDAKIKRLAQIFEMATGVTPPAPLEFIKAATGIGAGLNEQGDAAIALVPGANGASDARPLLLAPVSDYAKFAESVNGDASGEICRVVIAGEEVLVARRGDYAVLMNVEHRPTLEALLAADSARSDAPQPLAAWLGANDAAVVLTRAGVEALSTLGRESLDEQQTDFEDQLADPEFAEMLDANVKGLEIAKVLLGFANQEVQAAGVAVSIDEATNVRLSKRIAFAAGGEVAKLDDVKRLAGSPLAGFADEPFVFALGGPMPAQLRDRTADFYRRLIEANPRQYGFEKLNEAQWKQVEESWQEAMRGIRSTSTVMRVGADDDARVSNIFSIAQVDDSRAYLTSSRRSFELWNELLAESTSDMADDMKYEFHDGEVAGKPALTMVVDVAAAAADDNVPMIAPMLKSIFGGDGKFHMQIVAAGPKTVISAAASEPRVIAVIDQALGDASGLADSPTVQATTKLFDSAAAWQAVVSPQGAVAWVQRFVNQVFLQLGGGPGGLKIPDFPASPPVGLSAGFTDNQLQAEIVWPVATLESLADYIKTCMAP